jgi:hypothetical protein
MSVIEDMLTVTLCATHSREDARRTAKDILRRHAHQLAEEIRTTDLPKIHVDMFDNGTRWAADLIDPEVQR